MKNKVLLVVIGVLCIILGVVVSVKDKTNHSFLSEEKYIKVKEENSNQIDTVLLEDYLIGVLAAEIPASFELEALKAQAVASRTYALYKINASNEEYDIIASVTNQAYITEDEMRTKWGSAFDFYYKKVKKAIEDTKDEVMYYQDELIEAFYFSMSNGKTSNASYVFNEDLPYIQSVESTWENNARNFYYTLEIPKSEFCEKLNLTDCNAIQVSEENRDDTNRVVSIKINNKEFKGTEVRTLLNLRSTDFTFKIEEEKVIVTTIGYGHGVGMSQYGANGLAKEGKTYKDILNYYYHDILIKKFV